MEIEYQFYKVNERPHEISDAGTGTSTSSILVSRTMKSKFIVGSPTEMQQADHQKFFNTDPDGFSAERNKFIVEETIRQYDKTRAQKVKTAVEHFEERADAVVSFIKSVDKGKGAQGDLEKYFGRKMLAYLRGQQIRDSLMGGMMFKDKVGNIIKPTGI